MHEPSTDLRRVLKSLRLGKLLPTLPERLRIARERAMDPEDFLLVLLTEEIQRRDQQRHALRAKEAGLLPELVFDAWDRGANITFNEHLLDELRTLRFLERHHHVLIAGPVGVGKPCWPMPSVISPSCVIIRFIVNPQKSFCIG